MASIRKEIFVDADPSCVWAAIRDVGAIHTRLARGFVTDVELDGDMRLVTFANGTVVREVIVDIDDQARRLAYSAIGERALHHNASFQVFAHGERRSRIVWITDVLPHDLAGPVGLMVDGGAVAIKRTLDRQAIAA